jgi:hypothetical protein
MDYMYYDFWITIVVQKTRIKINKAKATFIRHSPRHTQVSLLALFKEGIIGKELNK